MSSVAKLADPEVWQAHRRAEVEAGEARSDVMFWREEVPERTGRSYLGLASADEVAEAEQELARAEARFQRAERARLWLRDQPAVRRRR